MLNRRTFFKTAAIAGAGPLIVPRHVLGGTNEPSPSDTVGGALIGAGGRGPGTHGDMCKGLAVRQLGSADDRTTYTDFRRVLDRNGTGLVAIATPPHGHALNSIADANGRHNHNAAARGLRK